MFKEHPILFSGPMVRAILNTKPGVWPAEPIDPEQPFKWQTRRVVKLADGNPAIEENRDKWGLPVYEDDITAGYVMDFSKTFPLWQYLLCPYGRTGGLLWVRETWQKYVNTDYIHYRANGEQAMMVWRPSIYMPRWASRITLQLKDVRVERVQDITEADAKAEGVEPVYVPRTDGTTVELYKPAFRTLWDSINLKRGYGWDINPLVWALEFELQK